MTSTIEGLPSLAAGVFERFLNIGASSADEIGARRIRFLNLLVLASASISMGFCALYGFYDWSTLKITSIVTGLFASFWLSSLLIVRVNHVLAVIYFIILTTVIFVIFAYVAGSSVGVHYHLLAAPCAFLLLGYRRILLSAFLMGSMFAGFFLIEQAMPIRGAVSPVPADLSAFIKPVSIVNAGLLVSGMIYYATYVAERAEEALDTEYQRSEVLLRNLMPESIAARLKHRPEEIIADHYDSVAILFADIVEFTPRAHRLPPEDVVRFLNGVFTEFDRLAAKHGLEKIKTVGDAYMVAGGMPERRDGHAHAVAEMALDMLEAVERLSAEADEEIAVRIGIHVGPAIAGVIGTRKLFYDVWGDTVNTASRMESLGSAGHIQVTRDAVEILADDFSFETRGTVHVKGKGEMELFYLVGRRRDRDAVLAFA